MRYIVALRRSLARGERGSSMPELMVAMAVLIVAVVGVIGSMGLGITLTGGSRQRSAASGVANQYTELVRGLASHTYTDVGLKSTDTVSNSSDTSSPDYNVTTDGRYQIIKSCGSRVDGSCASTVEPLVFGGTLEHSVSNPPIVGKTRFSVYQYVTWVNDSSAGGATAYKRFTVVVTWLNPVASGLSRSITESTFVGKPPDVSPVPTATPPGGGPPPTPGPTPTPDEACSGAAPTGSMSILSGATGPGGQAGYTNSITGVQVQMTATSDCSTPAAPLTAQLSNDGASFTDVTTLVSGQATQANWTIATGDGTKTISAQFRDSIGRLSSTYTGTIVLDATAPTTPTSLTKTACTISGSTRTATMTWNPSSDTNFLGYRIYQQINGGSFTAVVTVPNASFSDSALTPAGTKKQDTVAYKVRAYDKAGNESGDSNVLTIPSGNSC